MYTQNILATYMYLTMTHMYNIHVFINYILLYLTGTSTTPQVSAAISGHTSTSYSASTTGSKVIGTLHYITYYTRYHIK